MTPLLQNLLHIREPVLFGSRPHISYRHWKYTNQPPCKLKSLTASKSENPERVEYVRPDEKSKERVESDSFSDLHFPHEEDPFKQS